MLQLRLCGQLLLDWYQATRRDLPWRGTRDPWRILLSEVMLQQTRVVAVVPYYERFLERYPTPQALAAAPEQELLAAWSGLGYYARARNLQRAAKAITELGAFPSTLERIRELPGVGDYTAAAVASIAFGLPHAVLDGNVVRVLSRLTAERGEVQSSGVRVKLQQSAQTMLDPRRPGDFNQAVMELGATVCLPRNPQCLLCPLREHCAARAEGIQNELPVKLNKRDAIKLAIELLLVEKDGRVLMRQRGAHEPRLAGFWELPEPRYIPGAHRTAKLGEFRHSITRHDYTVEVWQAEPVKAPKGFRWIAFDELPALPLATTARKAFAVAGRPVPESGG
ncbi:MAG: A/G-specific adenine glycosylase [Bryobacteraceae bacterium]|nr:A/G-specific adenine glycosylase [Bryobacteraceae bacterium]